MIMLDTMIMNPDADLSRIDEFDHGRLERPQLERWSRLQRARDRRDFLAARGLAARLVATRAQVGPEAVRFAQHCRRCADPDPGHGRPLVLDDDRLSVSWSHSVGWGLGSWGPDGGRTGIEPAALDVRRDHVLLAGGRWRIDDLPVAGSTRAAVAVRL